MKSAPRFFVVATLCVSVCSSSVYFFDVGCGSFTVCRNDRSALVIDCGSGACSRYSSDIAFLNSVRNVFSGVELVNIIVTHAHRDHYNLIKYLFIPNPVCRTVIGNDCKLCSVLVCAEKDINDLPMLVSSNRDRVSPSLIHITNYKSHFSRSHFSYFSESVPCITNAQMVENFLISVLNSFGENRMQCSVELYLVNDDFHATEIHDVNLVVKVRYKHGFGLPQSVLIPGDASKKLIQYLLVAYKDDILQNVDYAAVAHHGSFGSGQEILLQKYMEHGIVPIVSSFPQAPHFLPRIDFIHFLQQQNILLNYKQCFSLQHVIFYAFQFDDVNLIGSYTTSLPIFITSGLRITDSLINRCTGYRYICCNFYTISNTLCYEPGGITKYHGLVRSIDYSNGLLGLLNYINNNISDLFNLLVDDICSYCQQCNVRDLFNLELAHTIYEKYCYDGTNNMHNHEYNLVVSHFRELLHQKLSELYSGNNITLRCVHTPLEDEDIAEAEDVRDIALHNECCLLL